MLDNVPSQSTMTELLGQSLFEVWQALCLAIDEKYDVERVWSINIVEVVKHFVAYMQKVIALVS